MGWVSKKTGMIPRTTLTLLAVLIATIGASAAQAAGAYRITKASAATNAKIARETKYEFTTNGSAVLFSYSAGAVLKLPHRLSDGTVEVWAGVTKPTRTRAVRLVLVNGGYYVGGDPTKFGWALADSGTAPKDPALTGGELAALTRAVGYKPAASTGKRVAEQCPGTLKVGNTNGILLVGKSIRAQSASCGSALNLAHAFLHKEIYGQPQEACVSSAGTSTGCRVDGWVCRDTAHGGASAWTPVECTSPTAQRVWLSEHSSSGA